MAVNVHNDMWKLTITIKENVYTIKVVDTVIVRKKQFALPAYTYFNKMPVRYYLNTYIVRICHTFY